MYARADAFLAKPLGVRSTAGSSRCDDAHAQRRARRAGQARRAVRLRGEHPPVDDPLVAELRAVEQRVVGVDQALVAAPVDLAGSRASPADRAASR